MAIGISQESNEICIPEDQAMALLTDAQLYKVCEEDILLTLEMIKGLEFQIENYDSLVTIQTEHIAYQDSIIQELQPSSNLLLKVSYFLMGLVSTKLIDNLGE